MSTADQQIADILAKYGEPIAGNIWRVQGQTVIYLSLLGLNTVCESSLCRQVRRYNPQKLGVFP